MEAFSQWLSSLHYVWFIAALVVIMVGLFFLFRAFPRSRNKIGQLLVLSGMCLISLLFYLLTFSFRVTKIAADAGFSARTMPRLWCVLMLPIAIAAYIQILKDDNQEEKFGRWGLALGVALGSIFSVILFNFVGYYICSAVFIFAVMWVMKERRWTMQRSEKKKEHFLNENAPGTGGESGIRTHGSCESLVFKTSSLNRSDISPYKLRLSTQIS